MTAVGALLRLGDNRACQMWHPLVVTQDPLTPEERDAVNRLLPRERQTGDPYRDLRAAFDESKHRRLENSEAGGKVIAATHRLLHSWPQTAHLLGEPETTLRRWAAPYRTAGEGSW